MRITKRLMAVFALILTVSACGNGENSQDDSAGGARSESPIAVQARSISESGQSSAIEVFLNGIPVSSGPVSVTADREKDYAFATAERLDANSIIDVLVDNGQETSTSLSVSSVLAGELVLKPSDAYFDKGLKAAAFDGENLTDGTPIVTSNGALRFLAGAATRGRTSQTEKAQSGWCTGKPNQNLDAAKQSFRSECGQNYSDQLGHKCDYKSDGFHCNGMVSDVSAPDKPTDTSGTQPPLRPGMAYCYGEHQDSIGNAQNYVYPNCGVSYQNIRAQQCVWSALGRRCGGQVPKDKLAVNPYSSLCERYGTFLEVRAPKGLVVSRMSNTQMLVQWKAQGCETATSTSGRTA